MRNFIWKLGRSLYLKGRGDDIRGTVDDSEKKLLQSFTKIFDSNKAITIFDIGANIGDWSLLAHSLYGSNENLNLYSFEPIPKTYKKLETSLQAINSTVENMAVSDSTGSIDMYAADADFAGTNSIYNTRKDKTTKHTVQTITFDDYLSKQNIAHVEFVKCDAEGHDFKIIEGAKGAFEKNKISCFQFEYNHRWVYSRTFLKDVFDLISGYEYNIAKITKNGLELYHEWHFELEKYYQSNFLIIHKSLIPKIKNLKKGKIGKGNVFIEDK